MKSGGARPTAGRRRRRGAAPAALSRRTSIPRADEGVDDARDVGHGAAHVGPEAERGLQIQAAASRPRDGGSGAARRRGAVPAATLGPGRRSRPRARRRCEGRSGGAARRPGRRLPRRELPRAVRAADEEREDDEVVLEEPSSWGGPRDDHTADAHPAEVRRGRRQARPAQARQVRKRQRRARNATGRSGGPPAGGVRGRALARSPEETSTRAVRSARSARGEAGRDRARSRSRAPTPAGPRASSSRRPCRARSRARRSAP